MKKLAYEFFSSLLFSIIGFILFVSLYDLLQMLKLEITWGGDKGRLFWGMFLGLPIGSILGVVLIDKYLLKMETWNVLSMIFAFLLGFAGVFGSLFLMDKFGGATIIIVLPLIVFLCIAGFRLGLLLR